MLTQEMKSVLEEQMNKELASYYLYLAMSAFADKRGLVGTTSWMKKQADEERGHFDKFFEFVCDRGEIPILLPLSTPADFGDSFESMFAKVVEHEKEIEQALLGVSNAATDSNDVQTRILLDWFLTEQVEEIKTAEDVLSRIQLAKDGLGVVIVDQELGKR